MDETTDKTTNLRGRVEIVLDEARPFLQADGGDVEFVSFESDAGVLVLRLLGNCANCPMSRMTLRAGIEKLLKLKIPEVNRVESVNRW